MKTRSQTSTASSSRHQSSADAVTLAIYELQQVNTIRLVIPEDAPRARNWAPHAWTPSTVLSRVRRPFAAHDVPIPAAVASTTQDTHEIVLDAFLGRHDDEMTDTYRGTFKHGPTRTSGLIVKMVDLQLCGPVVKEAGRLSTVIKLWDVTRSLQGTILPRMAGPFGLGTLFCFVFEDAGRELTGEELVQDSVRSDIRNAWDTLYDAGVELEVVDGTGHTFFRRGRDGRIKIAHLTDANILDDIDWCHSDDEEANKQGYRKESRDLLESNYLRVWEMMAKKAKQ